MSHLKTFILLSLTLFHVQSFAGDRQTQFGNSVVKKFNHFKNRDEMVQHIKSLAPEEEQNALVEYLDKNIPQNTKLAKVSLVGNQIQIEGFRSKIQVLSETPLALKFGNHTWTFKSETTMVENLSNLEKTFASDKQVHLWKLHFTPAHAIFVGPALVGIPIAALWAYTSLDMAADVFFGSDPLPKEVPAPKSEN